MSRKNLSLSANNAGYKVSPVLKNKFLLIIFSEVVVCKKFPNSLKKLCLLELVSLIELLKSSF